MTRRLTVKRFATIDDVERYLQAFLPEACYSAAAWDIPWLAAVATVREDGGFRLLDDEEEFWDLVTEAARRLTDYRILDMSDPYEALCYSGEEGLVLEIDGEYDSQWGDDYAGLLDYVKNEFGINEDEFIEDQLPDSWGRFGWTAKR